MDGLHSGWRSESVGKQYPAKSVAENQSIYLEYSKTEKVLLEYLEREQNITMSKFSKIALITHKEAENVLVKLISLNLIEIVFTEKQVFYKLP